MWKPNFAKGLQKKIVLSLLVAGLLPGIAALVATNGNGSVFIRISDNGEGIPSEFLERIFEPFFTTKSYGVGLGLTNVRRLIEGNGGEISVESRPGQGTCFTIHLPFVPSGKKIKAETA